MKGEAKMTPLEWMALYGDIQLSQIQQNTATIAVMASMPNSVREEVYWNNFENQLRINIENQMWRKHKWRHFPLKLILVAACIYTTVITFQMQPLWMLVVPFAWIFIIAGIVGRIRKGWLDKGAGVEIVRLAEAQVKEIRLNTEAQNVMYKTASKEAVNRMRIY
jgi:hypothetical protein